MSKIVTLETIEEVVGKRVKVIFPERVLPMFGAPEGVLSKDKVFTDLEGDEIESDSEYVVIYDSHSLAGGTYCSLPKHAMSEGVLGIELVD